MSSTVPGPDPRITMVRRDNLVDPTHPGDGSLVLLDWDTEIAPAILGSRVAGQTTRIYVPPWARWVKVDAHVLLWPVTDAAAVPGVAHIHLWRNDLPTAEAHYHRYKYFPAPAGGNFAGSRGVDLDAWTPWIPVLLPGTEYWTVLVGQTTGKPATIQQSGLESYFSCEFK